MAMLVMMVALCVAEPGEDSVAQLGEDASMPSSLDALHAHNNALIQQIQSLGGGAAPAGQAGQAGPLAGMLAMGPSTGGGGGSKQEGIKEALTAVKPIMDKYVNTAKTLTGKYTALKQAFTELKAEKNSPDLVGRARWKAKLKKADAKNVLRYSTLKGKYRSLERKEETQLTEAEKKETLLKGNNAKLEVQNHNIAESFMEELDNAKKAAHTQIKSLRTELNKFMSASNEASFDAIGEATEKALEEEKVMQIKTPQIEESIKRSLQAQMAKDKAAIDKKEVKEEVKDKTDDAESPALSR